MATNRTGTMRTYEGPRKEVAWNPKTRLERDEYLSPDELVDFVQFMRRRARPRPCRRRDCDRLMVETLALSGVRVSELINLRIMDVPPARSDGTILVACGKGRKRRQVDIPHDLGQQLAEWVQVRRRNAGPEDLVFVTSVGTRFHRQGVWNKIQTFSRAWHADRMRRWKRAVARGIIAPEPEPKHMTVHALRHSYATRFLTLHGGTEGALVHLQEQLGHSNIGTTLIYARTASPQRRAFADGLSI